MTRWVFQQAKAESDDLREQWMQRSWLGGVADEKALIELRTRAATLFTVSDRNLEEWMTQDGNDPQPE